MVFRLKCLFFYIYILEGQRPRKRKGSERNFLAIILLYFISLSLFYQLKVILSYIVLLLYVNIKTKIKVKNIFFLFQKQIIFLFSHELNNCYILINFDFPVLLFIHISLICLFYFSSLFSDTFVILIYSMLLHEFIYKRPYITSILLY